MNLILKSLLIFACISTLTYAKVTPSDVYVEAKSIKIALAQEVVRAKGVSLLPVIDIDLNGATPSSVYALGSALNFKLMIYAKSKNKSWTAASFPKTKIKPKQVKELLLIVEKNIESIFGISNFTKEEAMDKKPSDVGLQLTYANQWLDKIMPFVKPTYPLAILEKTEDFLDLILMNNNVQVQKVNPSKHSGIKPKDVFLNVTATYNLIKNLKRVYAKENSASHPYNILSATQKIKPLDIYSFTLFNLYFLYSLGVNLNTKEFDSLKTVEVKKNIKPNDVFRQADIVNYKLANIIAKYKGDL